MGDRLSWVQPEAALPALPGVNGGQKGKAGGDNPLRGDTRSSKKVKIPNREQKSRNFTEKRNRLLGEYNIRF
jgi:hypothetical protein